GITRSGSGYFRRKQILSFKARIDLEQPYQALNQQPCPRQENQRQRNLGHNQRVSHMVLGCTARGSGSRFQRVLQIQSRGLQGRNQSENYSGEERDYERELEHAEIER